MLKRHVLFGLVAAALIVSASLSSPARAGYAEAEAFVEDLGNKVIDLLKREDLTSFSEREAAFRDILIDGFDIRTISRAVLGPSWRELSSDDATVYQTVFTDFVVRIYTVRFDGYPGETFQVTEVTDWYDGDLAVRTKFEFSGSMASINLDFIVREVDESYKIIDVYVEGTSMLITQRSEFSAVIDRHGLEGLLDELRSRVGDRPETDTAGH
jgi:phospholipid transport system substrate-binding protein